MQRRILATGNLCHPLVAPEKLSVYKRKKLRLEKVDTMAELSNPTPKLTD